MRRSSAHGSCEDGNCIQTSSTIALTILLEILEPSHVQEINTNVQLFGGLQYAWDAAPVATISASRTIAPNRGINLQTWIGNPFATQFVLQRWLRQGGQERMLAVLNMQAHERLHG